LAVAAAWLMLVAGTCVSLDRAAGLTGSTGSTARLSSGALPPEVAGTVPASQPAAAGMHVSSSVAGSRPPTTAAAPQATQSPGIPVAIDIPLRSTHHPKGVHARVSSNPLNPDGSLFVPADPRAVSWARQDAAPGSARGTTILTSHINFVIDGQTVPGAFADLADYARAAVGQQLSVLLADGRRLKYRIVAGREYHKDELTGHPSLRASLYDQQRSYGRPGQPPTGRLLLVSCGGAFDNSTGEYEDNVFLYALPIVAPASAGPADATGTPSPRSATTAPHGR